MSLTDRLAARIREGGPISVSEFMHTCLHDPRFGYYATRPGLGEEGDFITAPMVSQMFGELIGLWAAQVWMAMGSPKPFLLVEAGPGDGALMSDMLRVGRAAPGFLAAADIWLIETSAPLRRRQEERLGEGLVRWTDSLADLPSGAPVILVANELLDCLPADQFMRTEDGWAQIKVGLNDHEELVFGLVPAPHMPGGEGILPGSVFEISLAQAGFGAALGGLIAREGGAALLIDYGRDAPGFGDTLQAVKNHQKVDPLQTAGLADLTVHADFPAVAAAARTAGAQTTAIITQAQLLKTLGIEQRAQVLSTANPGDGGMIQRQLERLIAPDQMGELFKALAIYHSPGLAIPGFEEA